MIVPWSALQKSFGNDSNYVRLATNKEDDGNCKANARMSRTCFSKSYLGWAWPN